MTDYDKPQQKAFTGVWLPAEILADDKLKPVDRILYAEIASFGSRGCWKKSEELQEICGVKDRAFQSACKRLEDNGYITQKRQFGRIFRTSTISFKHQRQNSSDEQRYNSSVHIDNTPEHTLENTLITNVIGETPEKDKEIAIVKKKKQPVPEINEMFDYWQEKVGYKIQARVKPNRNACSNLLKKHGIDKLKQLIDGVGIASQEEFAPRIADFSELQSKYNILLAWGQKRNKSFNKQNVRI